MVCFIKDVKALLKVKEDFELSWYLFFQHKGLKNCHLRALYAVLLWAAKLALSSKVKHNNSLKIHECLQQERGHLKGKVFRLRETLWVSLTPFYYADDKHCWKVIRAPHGARAYP